MKSDPPPIHVWFDAVSSEGTEHRITLENLPAPLPGPRFTLVWRAEGVPDLPLPPVVDSYVCGLALVAAKADRDLYVHGPVSRLGLYNLGQLLTTRHTLLPDYYLRAPAIIADKVVDIQRPPGDAGTAIAAFSGGLDSTFTLVRHALRTEGAGSHRLAETVMVHGFDTPLAKAQEFEALRARFEPLAARLGLPMHVVRTNTRALNGAAWPQSAIPFTANALAMFSHRHAVGVVSAGAPYNVTRMGLGHPPLLDAWASNGWFKIVTDGAQFNRAAKVDFLLQHPEFANRVKVCWEGADRSRNCGVCLKCLMTRFNFLAGGVDRPGCFDGPIDLRAVGKMEWHNVYEARDFFTMCWPDLERRRVGGPAVEILRKRMARTLPNPNFRDFRPWLRRCIVRAAIWAHGAFPGEFAARYFI